MWQYMEAVFSGGDIVKQLPAEAKRFQNIDKNYIKARRPGALAAMPPDFLLVPLETPPADPAALPRVHAAALPCAHCHVVAQTLAWCPLSFSPRPQIVTSALETQNVVAVCAGGELMKNMLPHLLEQLELCQKSLSAYLETKRAEFPRRVV
jgi:hypothetical protein